MDLGHNGIHHKPSVIYCTLHNTICGWNVVAFTATLKDIVVPKCTSILLLTDCTKARLSVFNSYGRPWKTLTLDVPFRLLFACAEYDP